MRNMVAVRLYKAEDLHKPWKDIPVAGYMPVVVGGDNAIDNITGRIATIYLNTDPTILKARWNYWEEDHLGYFVTSINPSS
jgi:hypothetical protein